MTVTTAGTCGGGARELARALLVVAVFYLAVALVAVMLTLSVCFWGMSMGSVFEARVSIFDFTESEAITALRIRSTAPSLYRSGSK